MGLLEYKGLIKVLKPTTSECRWNKDVNQFKFLNSSLDDSQLKILMEVLTHTVTIIKEKFGLLFSFGYFNPSNCYFSIMCFFSSTNTNITITRKDINRILIGLKHFKKEVCRYMMMKSDQKFGKNFFRLRLN